MLHKLNARDSAGGFVKAAVIGNKGYGFLDFDSHSAAAVAMKAMQEQPVPGASALPHSCALWALCCSLGAECRL